MPNLSLTISYQINDQYQVLSATELKTLYFSNVPLRNPDGTPISDDAINFWLKTSQKEVEDLLEVKLVKQAYQETRDFVFDDWLKWGYIPTTYPAVKGLTVQGFLNTTLQVDYPSVWLSVKRTSGGELYSRSISLVPVQGSANSLSNNTIVFQGVAPYIGYFGSSQIPNYWDFKYLTGFDRVPDTLIKAVSLKAAQGVLSIASQNVTGQPGVASKSIGIDGLSQSVTTTASGGKLVFQNLIDFYQKQYDDLMKILRKQYVGISLGVL